MSLITFQLSDLVIVCIVYQANGTLLHVFVLLVNVLEFLFMNARGDCTKVGKIFDYCISRYLRVLSEGKYNTENARTDAANQAVKNEKEVTVGKADHHKDPERSSVVIQVLALHTY